MTSPVTSVLLAWQAANTFGWGIVGLNIFSHWAVSGKIRPHMARLISKADLLALGPLHMMRIAAQVADSNALAARLEAVREKTTALNIPVVHSLGNRPDRMRITGRRNIGRMVFEETHLHDWPEAIKRFDILVCASTWNAELLRARFDRQAVLIYEGVDPSLFHPGPKSGILDPNRFYIFTGGKIEFRKSQDLVLLAFKVFAARHDDAVLVTAWHSPWPEYSAGFHGRLPVPLEIGADKRLAIGKWIADNGVDSTRVIDVGQVPNQMMPQILREMDCALQPSRAEACTNLVAMEAMACGLPVIVACNTGVRDLVDGSNCFPLLHQSAVEHPQDRGSEGWGESDVDEMVAALEALHQSPERRRQIGAAASSFMQKRTWARHAEELGRAVIEAQ